MTLCPVDDTILGPPGMQVEALANSLHMRFLAPNIESEPETWTMRNIYNSWAYNVQYWKNGSDEKCSIICQYDFEVLRNLEPWTTYCVQVQGFLPDRNKTGEWSEPVCEQTAKAETPPGGPSWSLQAQCAWPSCFFLAASPCCGVSTRRPSPPSPLGNSLPQHLKEFLGCPHHSHLLVFSFWLSDENEVFDKLSVIMQVSESSRQNPGNGRSPRTPSGQGPIELASKEDVHSAGYGNTLLLLSASEGDQGSS
ncbi:hypothetical protein MC885_004031 [Smutsia gigantea]|nr:hypothetical protein MC885_004031 [Smutsia gigantea]